MSSNQSLSSQIHRLPSQPLTQFLSQRPLTPISTSIPSFDHELSGGVVPGQIYEVSGLNGTGKTSLASQLCINALKMNKRVLWITTLKGLPLDKLQRMNKEIVDFQNLKHISFNTLGSLFLFLQALRELYGLIIIEDLSILIERSFTQLEDLISRKDKDTLQNKKNKFIQDIMKLCSAYCIKQKSACCLFNPVEILNMSFIETKQASQQHDTPSSSAHFHSSQPRQKSRFIHQPILGSALGDYPSWTSFIRARILLYKDWIIGSRVATFAHIKYNPMMKRILQYRNHTPRQVSFEVSGAGIRETQKDYNTIDVSHSFIVNEDIFTSDLEEEDGEEELEDAISSTLLESSPTHIDIHLAKDLLPSTLTNLTSTIINDGKEAVRKIFDDDMQSNEQCNSGVVEAGDNAELQEEDSAEEQDKAQEKVEEETGKQQEDIEDEKEGNQGDVINNLRQVEVQNLIREEISFKGLEEEAERSLTQSDEELDQTSNEEENEMPIDVLEIDDELEELFPSQPESLSFVQLSQFNSTPAKRLHHTLFKEGNTIKRPKIALKDATNLTQCFYREDSELQEDYIPASEPYF